MPLFKKWYEKVFQNDAEREAAISANLNENNLAEAAKNASDEELRVKAINRLTSEKPLIDILDNDDGIIHNAAAERLADLYAGNEQKLLDVISDIDTYDAVRLAAIRRIKDQSALENLARNSESFTTRIEAALQLEDYSIVADIARNDEEDIVRDMLPELMKRKGVSLDDYQGDESEGFDILSSLEKLKEDLDASGLQNEDGSLNEGIFSIGGRNIRVLGEPDEDGDISLGTFSYNELFGGGGTNYDHDESTSTSRQAVSLESLLVTYPQKTQIKNKFLC